MERAEARSLLGAAMVIAIPGRDPVDYHFSANVAVTYDGQDTARRISVMAPGSSVSSAPVSVGTAFGQCLDALREASIAHEEREAEIFLRDTGIRLLTSRAGDASLPVSSVVVERG
jgi:hypothetical protein